MQLLGNSFRTDIVPQCGRTTSPVIFAVNLSFSARPRDLSALRELKFRFLSEKWQHDFQMIDDMIGRITRLL